MLNVDEHIDNLIRHINLVRDACVLLGKKLIKLGRPDFGRLLICQGFQHDSSKFVGIEWEFLHAGNDVPKESLDLAIKQHSQSNLHHPEAWGGFENMPELFIAELACDWLARSQEFGTDIRQWIKDKAISKYNIDTNEENYKFLMYFINLLTENMFVKESI